MNPTHFSSKPPLMRVVAQAGGRQTQRGAAALVVTLMLFLSLGLGLLYASRTLVIDGRNARHQVESAQAFEAAEAGVEWMTARLNDPQRLEETCLPGASAASRNLRDRLLEFDASTGLFLPRTWLDGGVPRILQAACVGSATGWQCSCPAGGLPHPPLPPDGSSHPVFVVSLQAGTKPGTLQVNATGCNQAGSDCVAGGAGAAEAKAQVQTLLALLPALFQPPAATLTVRGDVEVPSGSPGWVNAETATGGVVVDAGGSVAAPAARLTSAPGSASSLAVLESDAALKALRPDRLFARHFGMDKPHWRSRPGVARVNCITSPCAVQVDEALAAGASQVWVDGDLRMTGDMSWGRTSRPVVLVVKGEMRIDGTARIDGMVYGRSVVWAGGGAVRGALVSEGDYRGDGSPELVYDAALLKALNTSTGDFVRVPGSWKDF